MTSRKQKAYLVVLSFLSLALSGCKTERPDEKESDRDGRKRESYVSTLMVQYKAPSERRADRIPPPPVGWSYLSVGAIYKGDTLRILLDTVKELVSLSEIADSPVDSISIARLVKGDSFLNLNEKAFETANIIKPAGSIDAVRLRGKAYTLKNYFNEKGYQKVQLGIEEQAALIDALSNWGLFIWHDDMVGLYRVEEPTPEY